MWGLGTWTSRFLETFVTLSLPLFSKIWRRLLGGMDGSGGACAGGATGELACGNAGCPLSVYSARARSSHHRGCEFSQRDASVDADAASAPPDALRDAVGAAPAELSSAASSEDSDAARLFLGSLHQCLNDEHGRGLTSSERAVFERRHDADFAELRAAVGATITARAAMAISVGREGDVVESVGSSVGGKRALAIADAPLAAPGLPIQLRQRAQHASAFASALFEAGRAADRAVAFSTWALSALACRARSPLAACAATRRYCGVPCR